MSRADPAGIRSAHIMLTTSLTAPLDGVTQDPGPPSPPRPRTLIDVFTATVAANSLATALEAPDATFTYRELAAAAEDLAGRLADHGIRSGDRVAVQVRSGTSELYLAILGILWAGAAYVPIDVDDPPARVTDILRRSGVSATVRDGLVIDTLADMGGADRSDAARHAGAVPTRPAPAPPTQADDAWIIFTSGSTGAPKGVAVTHRSAAAFVDAERRLWHVGGGDRVLAGLSVGFDASCEEIWLAWGNGAALVPAPRDLVRSGVELGDWLLTQQVTVVSTVPSLAALWDESCLHQVRLLILGGEACPEPLGWRLSAGREVWNTYGPTEATVVSTAAPIRPGAPVRIGTPLAGWEVAVMDGDQPVPAGTPGELVIGGVGLGRYLDPELDAERYAPIATLGWSRAYRTGDIVIAGADGLEFVGRRDDQVKIGGRRIELGEIEAALCAVPGVGSAAAAVRQSAAGNPLLVGYVVGDVDPRSVRATVGQRLPSGVVPLVVVLDELPLAPSGKVDRRALPWPAGGDASGLASRIGADGEPLTEFQSWLAERWVQQLGPQKIRLDSDFFALGGASLAVAKLVSVLRASHPTVAVSDVYRHPTLRALARRLDELGGVVDVETGELGFRPRAMFGAAQIVGVLALCAFQAMPWVLATFAYGEIFSSGIPRIGWVWLIAGYGCLASPPARVLIQVTATRLLTRDLVPGRYRRDSWLAWRLWFLSRLADLSRADRVGGTPFAPRYARLVGARVGHGARLASVPELGRLLSVGAGATLEGGVDARGWWIDSRWLVVGSVTVGAGARVGSRTLLQPGAVVGEGAEIEPGSVVSGEVPAGERWGGVPAVALGRAGDDWPDDAPNLTTTTTHGSRRGLFAASVLFEEGLMLLSTAPGVVVLWLMGGFLPTTHTSTPATIGEVLLDVALWVPSFAILIALTLRLIGRLITPGYHPDYGLVGWALWFSEELRQTAQSSLFPLYASLFTRPWLRLMGLTVGRGAEVSTSTGLNPLVSIGALCQSTDDVAFCGVRSRHGWIHVAPVSVGAGTFLGPGSVLRGGTEIGEDSLIGVLTLAPLAPASGTAWLGVPAIELPRSPALVDPARTVSPPRRLVLARLSMDLIRLLLPNMAAVLIGLAEFGALAALATHVGVLAAVLCAPVILFGGGIAGMLVTIAVKWVLIGRYRPSEHPLWSFFVWRDELLNATQEQLAVGGLLGLALGTPLVSLYLRAMGARVGAGAWIETAAFTEYEMIDLGDCAVANRGSCLMTHLFHDRVLRIGPTRLASGATLGPCAAVLPDTILGANTVVEAHSVVLRGEELPDHTRWHGVPVVPAAA